MALNKEQRDALPDSDFAVPGKRALPIHDERHVKMAWDMVDRTKGLTSTEKKDARKRILERAHNLGIDTSNWNKIKAMAMQAMSLNVPHVDDHPNRVPFDGVLTFVDQPSDQAPHGSNGKRVQITREAAQAALPSLLGMAVDFADNFEGHDPVQKFGIITAATIEGDEIQIEGFLYGSDFPVQTSYVQAHKDDLGFSYEVERVLVASLDDDPLIVTSLVFTGAAILEKDKAAYTTTSIAAQAEEYEMTEQELKALQERLDKLEASNEQLQADNKALKADNEQLKINAGSVAHLVKPHSDAIRAAADGMEKAGLGADEKRGHVAHLRRMADNMDAAAVMGKLPHYYVDESYMYASAEQGARKSDEKVAALEEKLAAQAKTIEEMQAAAKEQGALKFQGASEPERKTLPPHITALLARADISTDEKSEKKSIAEIDKMLAAANITGTRAIEAKLHMRNAGLIKEAA